jgi:hypothetical protein
LDGVSTDTTGVRAIDLVALRQMVMGFRLTQLVHVAAQLGLADVLHERPATVAELAARVDADPSALGRVLRALASVGLFAEDADEPGRYLMTPLAEGLRRDVPGSLHPVACLYGAEWLWDAYGRALHSVRTGEPGFDAVHGEPLYEFLDGHPEAAATFHGAMSAFSAQEQAAILDAYDFSGVSGIVDVGGGEGALLEAILRANPTAHGVLFDLAPALVGARQRLDPIVARRIDVVAGDFFDAITLGGDLYVLKSVLHNWSDEEAVVILRRCRDAMVERGRVLVAERVIAEGDGPSEAKLFDLNMLVVVGGRERTVDEFADLFGAAGLAVTHVVETASPLSLVEGVRA